MNIQHSLAGKRQQRLYMRYRQIRVFRRQWQINYTIRALIRASVPSSTTRSKPEVYLHHTAYFHTKMLAIILELFSILYRCYYSQNYSGIIISGLLHTTSCLILSRLSPALITYHPGSPLPVHPVHMWRELGRSLKQEKVRRPYYWTTKSLNLQRS